jgi:protein-disulfide isomerase
MKYQKEVAPIIEPKDMIVGDPKAPVTIVEFGDYESDACAKANEVVKELLEAFPGKIKFVFRHFPLTRVHQKAHKAAEAAIGAGQEGLFWEMHQELFAHRRNLGVISLKSYAKDIGVKNKRYLEDLINGLYGWNVQADLMEGLKMGVRDIPVFFINNERFEKEPSFENLNKHIKSLLKNISSTVKPDRKKVA